MDALFSAVLLARALLALAEAGRTGVLRVRSGHRRAEVTLCDGVAVALTGLDGELLGDALLRDGELDASRHRVALTQGEPGGPVGQWLVSVGAASREAVDRALSRQLAQRLAALLRLPRPILQFDARLQGATTRPAVRALVPSSVWDGMLQLTTAMTQAEVAELSGRGRQRLTRAGARFVCALRASGHPVELEHSVREVGGPDAAWVVLRVLGLLVDARVDSDSFSLLLRKQREIRRHLSARALLDLPPHAAPDHARRALRRLAHKLHPDRFATEVPALCAVAAEVMGALCRAEETLRATLAPYERVG